MKSTPNFLLIGATKSGTSSLYFYLRQHPDIYMSATKEPHFFALSQPEVERIGGPDGALSRQLYVTDPKAYEALFQPATDEKVRGEASAMYIYYPDAPRRIEACLPEVKLVAILRNPVERAYSAFLHKVRDGLEVHTDFAAALEEEPKRIAQNWGPLWYYRKMGFYHQQLSRYYQIFDAEQLKIVLYEDFRNNPVAVIQDIFRFLEVDDSFVPDVSVKRNISGVPKNRLLHQAHRFLQRPSYLKTVGKTFLPAKVRFRLKTKALVSLETKNLEKPALAPEVRQNLIDTFREDILKLQELIGRDLSAWLEQGGAADAEAREALASQAP